MNTCDNCLRSQRGMVLMSSLVILSVLLAVGIGVAVMLRNDFQVLANLRGATEAFYFSSAGLEWGKREIAQATSFPPVPANQSKYFSSGEFAVSFLSSTAVGPLEARVVVRSSGTSRGAQHILQAQLTKAYDLTDAALALRGNGAGVSFSAATLFISGADHDPTTGNPIPGARPRSSVSTDEIVHGLVLEALGDPPRQDILYNDPDTPAVATSGYLSAGFVTELANGLCASAPATLHSIPSTGGLTVENQIWGDPASPQLHCIEGSSASGDAATFTGNFAGAGVLVIRNADLILTGTFQWEGLIIVTGTDVSLKTTGSSNKDLLGAAIVSETGIPGAGRAVLDMEGTIRLMFSRKALDRAVPLIPTVILNSAYESLPSVISQNYWRAVTP